MSHLKVGCTVQARLLRRRNVPWLAGNRLGGAVAWPLTFLVYVRGGERALPIMPAYLAGAGHRRLRRAT